MPHKMLTCTCGNTELDKVPVRLSQNGNGHSLGLIALMCKGSGCGRVTFRPDESKGFSEPAETIEKKPDVPKTLVALFERVYTERLVYKAIAERDPNCSQLFAALKTNSDICGSISETFAHVRTRLEAKEELLTVLESLPSLNGDLR